MERATSWLGAVVETWLGLSRPVARDAIADANFAADPYEMYCPRCGSSVGLGEAVSDGCAECRGEPAIADRVIRLARYDSPLRDWVAALKYEGWAEIGTALGTMLGHQIGTSGFVDLANAIVVPVPMPWQRRIYRGIDHARVIAEAAARALKVDLFPILAKRNGQPQVQRTASERRRGRKDWIRVRRRLGGWPLDGLDVILVDDVKTTGTTLRTCRRLLKELGAARVIVAVLAVADSPARARKPAVFIESTIGAAEVVTHDQPEKSETPKLANAATHG